MNLQLLLGVWAAVFLAWATVSLMRHQVGKREDDHIHFNDGEQQLLAAQSMVAHKLDVLDRWKGALMILMVVIGLLAGAYFVWQVWQQSTSTIQLS
jgi:hypothetical protein